MKSTAILIFTCLHFLQTVESQEAWTLKKDKNGIKVFSRKYKNFKFNELKVETIFNGKISQLAAVIFDIKNQKEWVYKTVKSELLKTVTEADVYYYTEIEVPWPLDNRDMAVRMTMQQNPQTKVMTIVAKNVDDYLPARKDKVRIKYSNATWMATPISNSRYKVEYSIQFDPGDDVPAWILNLFSTAGPYESFINLKEKIKQPRYAHVKFPLIID